LLRERADSPPERIGDVDGGGIQKIAIRHSIDASADEHFNRDMAW
jgi:hypothetical protein